jgi:hypothetical protein
MSERKQINFTIVPDESTAGPRTYANFCAIAHTPFDCTLTFCEVQPLSEQDLRAVEAGASEHVVRAPVRARIVLPLQSLPALVAALQEHLRTAPQPQGPVH